MTTPDQAKRLLGLGLTGYGLLILLQLVAHEALWVGVVCTALGLVLLVLPSRGTRRGSRDPRPATASSTSMGGLRSAAAMRALRKRAVPAAPETAGRTDRTDGPTPPADRTDGATPPADLTDEPAPPATSRERIVALIGIGAVGGVIGYNLVTGFDLGVPEVALMLYGVALVLASSRLDRPIHKTDVGTMVAWSFPVLLAPLVVYSVNAALSGPLTEQAGTAARPVIIHTLVIPMAYMLRWTGSPNRIVGDNIILELDNGSLALGVGLVCSGLYPMVLFAGLLGLHGWRERLSARRFSAYLAVGLGGLFLVNLIRLVLLAKVGERWGGAALQQAHAHFGWLLFVGFMVLFWGIVLRWVEANPPAMPPPTA